MGPWTKCSDFQPMICESKWGWGWGRGERGFWPHIRAAIFPRSSEGQQITLGSHWLSWCLILSRPCPLCSPSSPQPSSSLHGSLCRSRLPDLVPPPSTHWNPAHPFRAHLYTLFSIQVWTPGVLMGADSALHPASSDSPAQSAQGTHGLLRQTISWTYEDIFFHTSWTRVLGAAAGYHGRDRCTAQPCRRGVISSSACLGCVAWGTHIATSQLCTMNVASI